MLVSELGTQVKRAFGDEAGVQIADADIIRWVNMGQRDFVLQNQHLYQKTTTTNIVANQQAYSVPADNFTIRTVRYATVLPTTTNGEAYYKLHGMSLQEFDEYIDGWDGSVYGAADPVYYTIFNDQFLLFPIPDHAVTSGLKINYCRKPTDVTAAGSTIDVPDSYLNALIHYCLQQAYILDEDWSAAGNASQMTNSDVRLNSDINNWNNREHYPRITVRDDDWWI